MSDPLQMYADILRSALEPDEKPQGTLATISAQEAHEITTAHFLRDLAGHFGESFDTACGAYFRLHNNLSPLVDSPQGQSAISLLFIQQAGSDHEAYRPVVH